MPQDTSRPRSRTQALNQRQREAVKQRTARHRYLVKLQKAQQRQTDAVYKRALKAVRGKGIYDPKSIVLTKYRRTKIKAVLRDYRELLDPKKYVFLHVPKGKKRKETLTKAAALDIPATKTGLFAPRGSKNTRKPTLRTNKKTGELFIRHAIDVKRGPRGGKSRIRITPIASIDELTNEEQRLERLFKELRSQLTGSQRIVFVVRENGSEGYSHAVFLTIGQLNKWLSDYKKSAAARIQFYRHIELEITESSLQWFTEHPVITSADRKRMRRQGSPESRARGRL